MAIAAGLLRLVLPALVVVVTCTSSATAIPLPPKRTYDATHSGGSLARRSEFSVPAQLAALHSSNYFPVLCWVTADGCSSSQLDGVFFTVPALGTPAQELVVNGSDSHLVVGGMGSVEALNDDAIFDIYFEDPQNSDSEQTYMWFVSSDGTIKPNWGNTIPQGSPPPVSQSEPLTFFIYNEASPQGPVQGSVPLIAGFAMNLPGGPSNPFWEEVTLQFVPSNQIAVTESGASAPLCWVGANGCETQQSSALFFEIPVVDTLTQELTVLSGSSDAGQTLTAIEQDSIGVQAGLYVTSVTVSITDLYTGPNAAPGAYSPGGYYETSIWNVDSYGNIQANWVNPDVAANGIPQKAPLNFFVDTSSTPWQLGASGYSDYAALFGFIPVTLQFS